MNTELKKYYAPSFYELHPDKKFYSEWCVNAKLKIIFITINKCAGSSLREYLQTKKFDVIDNNDIDDEYILNKIINNFNFYSVIRNPKDRYISGLNEVMYQNNQINQTLVENNIKNNQFVFDEHLLPQFESLYKILRYNKKINLIRMDENLNKKISNLFQYEDTMPTINSHKEKKNAI